MRVMTTWGVSVVVGSGREKAYLVVFGRGLGDCDLLERVVHFARLALDFLDGNGGWHYRDWYSGTLKLWKRDARITMGERSSKGTLGVWGNILGLVRLSMWM